MPAKATKAGHPDQKQLSRLLFSAVKDCAIFMLDPRGRVLTWSAGAEHIIGYPAEEIIGRSFEGFYHTEDVYRGKPQRELELAVANGSFEEENWRLRKDGSQFWADVLITALRDANGDLLGFAKIARDLTRQRLVEDIFRAMVETTPDAIVVTNSHGKIELVNAQTERLLRYSRAELIGLDIEMLIPARFRDKHPLHRAEFAANPRPRSMGAARELYVRRRDGSEVPVEISLGPFEMSEGVFVSAVIRDLTERRRIEAEANHMKMVASARLSALSTMAGGIAHEINNPLAVIHALASDLTEMVERGAAIPEEVVRYTRRIEQYAERIAKIITSLRHLSRDGGTDPFDVASLNSIVERALDLCKEHFRGHSVDLVTPRLDPRIYIACREVQISQVLFDLLQNAFDAAQEQNGAKWVRLEISVEDGVVVLSVIDSGKGVPPELKARIMDPFFTTKPAGKGTGLGLSLAKQIAEQHGGTLALSEAGGHTCFSLSLPLSRQESEPWN